MKKKLKKKKIKIKTLKSILFIIVINIKLLFKNNNEIVNIFRLYFRFL